MTDDDPFPPKLTPEYTLIRRVPEVGWCGVHRLLFHWTVHYGISEYSIEGRYCFQTESMAWEALLAWDGKGDMPGRWHKHPPTGRRRDPDTGEIWHESERRD